LTVLRAKSVSGQDRDEPVVSGSGGDHTLYALALQPDGRILAGGLFYSMKGMNRNGIARLNEDGSPDPSFDPGTGAFSIHAIVLQPDGRILIGGYFELYNGINRKGIARLNPGGGLDATFDPGTGAYAVAAIALQPDGKMLIGGAFTVVNGTNRIRIARLNANGSLDSSFDPGIGADGVVGSIAVQPDANVLISGDFIAVNGTVRPYAARLYGGDVAQSLNITRTAGAITLSWPPSATGFVLEQSSTTTVVWSQVALPCGTNANVISVSVPSSSGNKFYRVRRQ
jgi:uncharacterized delta-60 repeat protein